MDTATGHVSGKSLFGGSPEGLGREGTAGSTRSVGALTQAARRVLSIEEGRKTADVPSLECLDKPAARKAKMMNVEGGRDWGA